MNKIYKAHILYAVNTLMRKSVFFVLATLLLVACDRQPVEPSTPDTPAQPLTDGDVIENAVTDYDGNTYDAVVIGEQVWMKSNLHTTHFADGTEIPLESEVSDSIACYYYEDNGQDVADYGYLYNWKAVMHDSPASNANPSGVQGICPTGWHVPSIAEWSQLADYLHSQSQYYCCEDSDYIAKALASETGWHSYTESGLDFNTLNIACCVGNPQFTNNTTGFSAFPAGFYGDFYYGCQTACVGQEADFWSTTEHQDVSVVTVVASKLVYSSPYVCGAYHTKHFGCSVRCLRD